MLQIHCKAIHTSVSPSWHFKHSGCEYHASADLIIPKPHPISSAKLCQNLTRCYVCYAVRITACTRRWLVGFSLHSLVRLDKPWANNTVTEAAREHATSYSTRGQYNTELSQASTHGFLEFTGQKGGGCLHGETI